MRWLSRWLRHCWHRDLIWRLEVIEQRLTVQSAALAKLTVLLKEVTMSQAREIDKGKRPGAKPPSGGAGAGGGKK